MSIDKILDQINVPPETCEYWDVRVEEVVKTDIKYDEFELVSCGQKPSLGAFIRVYYQGMWFYRSSTDLTNLSSQIVDLAEQASRYEMTRKESIYRPYNQESYRNCELNFESTRLDKQSLADKKAVCESYFETIQKFERLKGVKIAYADEYKIKSFRSSTSARYCFDFNQCGLSVSYSVVDKDGRFDDSVKLYGKSLVELEGKGQKIKDAIEESHLFTGAKMVESGRYPVVMDSGVVGVFAHESFGHKSEADFMLGDEQAKETWKIGKKVGSECLSIVDYGGDIGTSGYCPFDDEGFPTQKTYLIKNGELSGRLHSQGTSVVLDEAPTGNARAMSFEFEPIVRMTNTYVEPGKTSLKDLISHVKLGIYAKDFNHGSGLSTFTIAPRKCYMIREGRIAEPVRVSVISGSVFETLGQIEGCTEDFELVSSAFGGCGKMEQWPLPVGFGGPKVLVNQMLIS